LGKKPESPFCDYIKIMRGAFPQGFQKIPEDGFLNGGRLEANKRDQEMDDSYG
jgi:hypothetical protein